MKDRRPYLVPASNYYVLVFAISGAVFFVVWGVMHDLGSDMPWIIAGIAGSGLLFGSVIVREIFMRRAARQRFEAQARSRAGRPIHSAAGAKKLTIEQNEEILEQIRRKSNAANVLGTIASGHREVFELCGAYLSANEAELKTISASSPRLAPLLRSRSKVIDAHRFHMLKWAEIESRSLTAEIRKRRTPSERSEAARDAMEVIDTALASYPAEQALIQSKAALHEISIQIKVSEFIDAANTSADAGDLVKAQDIMRDALYFLGRQQGGPSTDLMAEQIRAEIDLLEGEIVSPSGRGKRSE
ncbi:MAG: hypothetical protein KF881_06370 [Acidobacteria bacterium]|nr:hypothetical protein [Acidobacteriota bacterium]